ncbi:MAG: hypothetical protein DI585_01735 [Pseudomonas fluorescens]|nr:MAG: hypothetical protein DI585_01735 [Pseudomonas fluorescens]
MIDFFLGIEAVFVAFLAFEVAVVFARFLAFWFFGADVDLGTVVLGGFGFVGSGFGGFGTTYGIVGGFTGSRVGGGGGLTLFGLFLFFLFLLLFRFGLGFGRCWFCGEGGEVWGVGIAHARHGSLTTQKALYAAPAHHVLHEACGDGGLKGFSETTARAAGATG